MNNAVNQLLIIVVMDVKYHKSAKMAKTVILRRTPPSCPGPRRSGLRVP